MPNPPQAANIFSQQSGRLRRQSDGALARLSECTLCPRACRVDRLAREAGVGRTGRFARVASFTPHFGKERPLPGCELPAGGARGDAPPGGGPCAR